MASYSNYLGSKKCCLALLAKNNSGGSQGPQGYQGSQGALGFVGSQGVPGSTGPTGPSQWTNMNTIGPQGAGYTGIGVTGQDVLIHGNLYVSGIIDPSQLIISNQYNYNKIILDTQLSNSLTFNDDTGSSSISFVSTDLTINSSNQVNINSYDNTNINAGVGFRVVAGDYVSLIANNDNMSLQCDDDLTLTSLSKGIILTAGNGDAGTPDINLNAPYGNISLNVPDGKVFVSKSGTNTGDGSIVAGLFNGDIALPTDVTAATFDNSLSTLTIQANFSSSFKTYNYQFTGPITASISTLEILTDFPGPARLNSTYTILLYNDTNGALTISTNLGLNIKTTYANPIIIPINTTKYAIMTIKYLQFTTSGPPIFVVSVDLLY